MAFNEKARATIAERKARQQAAKDDLKRLRQWEKTLSESTKAALDAGAAPQPAAVEASSPSPVTEVPAAEMPKAPPPNLFNGQVQKLAVFGKPGTDPNKPIPGYELYWFDDIQDGMIIHQAKASGWEFVEKYEIALNDAPVSPGNTALDSHVRRWVTSNAGQPVYSYLMKKPDDLYKLHMEGPDSMEQKVLMPLEERLRAGTLNDTPDQRRYTANNVPSGFRSIGHVQPIVMGRSRKTT
jgi:hypothetical protein